MFSCTDSNSTIESTSVQSNRLLYNLPSAIRFIYTVLHSRLSRQMRTNSTQSGPFLNLYYTHSISIYSLGSCASVISSRVAFLQCNSRERTSIRIHDSFKDYGRLLNSPTINSLSWNVLKMCRFFLLSFEYNRGAKYCKIVYSRQWPGSWRDF